jgi:AraC-like DNA-binding protein/mannose-6-phosphate isomerase-like protein (cupin superfamily)
MSKEKNTITFYRKDNVEIVNGISKHSFPEHSHRSFCIGVVLEGEMQLVLKGEAHGLVAGDVYLIPPNVEHKIEAVDEQYYSYKVICVKGEHMQNYDGALLMKSIYSEEDVVAKVYEILRKFEEKDDGETLVGEITALLAEKTEIEEVSLTKEKNDVVLAVRDYIEMHLNEPFNLNEIADYVHYSKYYLVKIFKMEMGVAPYQFYMQEKVKRAKEELTKENSPVRVAGHLNFADQSHLCNTFKKHVGITPLEFRKNYKKYK